MLHVASARGVLSWGTWREAYDSVAASYSGLDLLPCNRAASQLDSLGHIEIAAVNGDVKIAAAPAVLSLLPRLGLPTGVLCGGRSPHTEAKLSEAAAANSARLIIYDSPKQRQKPPRAFFLEAEDVSHLSAAASAAGVYFASVHPAWSLVNASGNVDSYLNAIEWRHEPEPNLRASEFDIDSLRFAAPRPGANGARLLRYFPRRLPSFHEFRDGVKAARTDRAWGMYAALKAHGKNCIVHDSHAKIVAVPASAPLPRLLARALTLCSGLAPAWLPATEAKWPFKEADGFLVYTTVPDSIAKVLFGKVGQTALPLHIPGEFLRTLNYHRPYE